MQTYYSIQILRALAALSVLLFHIIGPSFVIGAAGVDVFFVISGFIMGACAISSRPLPFFYHRLVRIVPLYWGVTLAMCLGALMGVFSTFDFTLSGLWKSLLFIPYYDQRGLLSPLVEVGWTLNLEMFFYCVFCLGLVLRRPLLACSLTFAALVVFGLVFEPQSALLAAYTTPLLLEFIAGLALSQMLIKSAKLGYLALSMAVIAFGAAFFLGEQAGLLRILTWGIPAALLVAACLWLECAGHWPRRLLRPLELVGDASYALYLTHGLVISLVYKFLSPGLLAGAAIVILSIVIAIVIHLAFERPVYMALKRRQWPWSSAYRAKALT